MPADHGGYYRPADRAIRLAEGKAPNHRVHTLIHEYADVFVMPTRLRRSCSEGFRAVGVSA
jgi:hypothetical protein